jgi:GrpB-like predicted nucleotidyltransferase (UPF0157 family)
MVKVTERCRSHEPHQLYGWVENGEIFGVCGYEAHADYIEIQHIAVAENKRRQGVGGKMVAALQASFNLPIEAETDDDAVDFYRKCGFEATAISKYDVRRWTCVLPLRQDDLFYYKDGFEEERAALYPIILREYNPEYPVWFAEERDKLTRLIGAENIVRIRHIGSTSVPDLLAKPIIDILLEIADNTDMDKLIAALHEPEYICLNPPDMPTPPPHLMFIKGYTDTGFAEQVYHVHVRYKGDWDEPLFRDYLIAHPDIAAEYGEFKRGLFADFVYDRDGYTYAKTDFIKSVMVKARNEK